MSGRFTNAPRHFQIPLPARGERVGLNPNFFLIQLSVVAKTASRPKARVIEPLHSNRRTRHRDFQIRQSEAELPDVVGQLTVMFTGDEARLKLVVSVVVAAAVSTWLPAGTSFHSMLYGSAVTFPSRVTPA